MAVDGIDAQSLDTQQSTALATRANTVLQTVPGLDHQTAVTLAQQPTSDQQLAQNAQSIGDSIAQTWDGYEHAFFDPTLQAQPSTAQAVADYVHSTLGPPAVSSGSITQLQSSLIKDGYLSPSSATGVWDAASESAYNAAVNTYKSNVLAGGGGKPLTSKVSSLVHSLFHDATHPWDAVSGWYDSVVQAVGDVAGGVAGIGDDIAHGQFGSQAGKDLFASVSQHTMNALTSGNTSAAAQHKIHQNPLNALGDAVAVAGVTSVAKSALKGAVEQAGKGAAETATKSLLPGGLGEGATTTAEHLDNAIQLEKIGAAISGANKLGFVGRSINDIGNALRAGTLPASAPEVQRSLGIVSKTLLKTPGAVGRALTKNPESLVSKTWAAAQPGLARLAPVATPIAKLSALAEKAGIDTSQGFAYTVRNALASPYKYAPVRAAGIAYQRGAIGSIAAHVAANALPGSQLQKNVDAQGHNVLDSFLDNTKVGIPGFEMPLSALPVGFLHGDLVGAGKASAVVGDAVSGFTNGLASKMGDIGMPAAFQSALGLSRKDLMDIAGGSETRLGLWMNNKLNDYAGDLFAQRQLASDFTGGKAEEADALTAAKQAWYTLPDAQKQQWVAALVKSDPHMQGFQTRIKQDVLRNAVDPKAAARDSLSKYFDDTQKMQDFIASGGAHYVIGPRSGRALAGEDVGGEQLAQLTAHEPGAIGMQGTEVKTGSEMRADGADLQAEYNKAPTEALREDAVTKMIDYLHVEGNMDASHLDVFRRNPSQLMAQIQKLADSRAEEVLPTFDQPDWVAQHIADLKASGKRIVIGTHIGHTYDGTLPQLATMDGWMGPIRKWAGKVGLDPQRIPDAEVGHAIAQSKDANIHHFLTTDPDAKLATQHADFRTVRAVLANATKQGELNPLFSGLLSLTSKIGLNKAEIAKRIADAGMQADGNPLSRAAAEGQLKAEIGSQFGLRDIPKKQVVAKLMTDHEVPGPQGSFTWRGVDKHTATGIVNAAHAAYRQPGYMMGLETIENWARAGFGVGDKLVQRNPDNPLYQAVSNWPNSILRARNQLRFTVSPLFAARVATKTRYKATLEGVNIPFNPLKSLVSAGADKTALDTLSRITGKVPQEQMDADRYLLTRDVFGIHDSQWDKAYFVHKLTLDGKSPAEVKDSYNKVFGYGTDGGRSALERTANTLFFPFSFDKTLYRNTGAFILDHPGTALMLDNAVEEWRVLDKNSEVGKFVNDHLPILKEMQLLNAFSHGISPGQWGGINAPLYGAIFKGPSTAAADVASGKSEALLNLLLPQSWGPNFTPKNLAKYLPIWKQFGTLMTAAHDQINIVDNAAHDTTSQVLGWGWKPEPTLTPHAQVSAALAKKAQLVNDPGVKGLIEYNAKQSTDADKYTWPQSPKLPQTMWGKPIDKTTVSLYVQYLYPAYNPQKAADFAVQSKTQEAAFIQNVARTDKAKAAQLQQFATLADQLVGHLNRDDYDTATATQTQAQFHDAAQRLAETDPQWLAFYTKYYRASLGPITNYNGKKAAA